MDEPLRSARRTRELELRYERYLRRGFIASVLLHILLFLIFWADTTPPSPFAAAGPRAGDDAAAAGGGMRAVQLRSVVEQEIPRPPEPVPLPDVDIRMEDLTEPAVEAVAFADLDGVSGEREGPEQGPGLETGTGLGDGGTAAEGRFRVVPPSPRGMILPPSDRPRTVRGKEVSVWVYVTEGGRVISDSTRLRPSTGDRTFDDRLRRQAAEWVFEPARRGGQPVSEWFQYVISL